MTYRYHKGYTLSLVLLLLISQSCTNNVAKNKVVSFNSIPKLIKLNNITPKGVFVLNKQNLIPNKDGVIANIQLELPNFEKGIYYRPFSKKKTSCW